MDNKNPDGLDIRLSEFLQKLKEENDALKKVLEEIRTQNTITKGSSSLPKTDLDQNPENQA